jgi:hypothetical protein
MILQECQSSIVDLAQSNGWSAVWTGRDPKGLAVLASPRWLIQPLPQINQWWLPVSVTGAIDFTVVGFWAMDPKLTSTTYTRQATTMVEGAGRIEGPIVLGGDFNDWASKSHFAAIERLNQHGLRSAYHSHRGVTRNSEADPTLYFQWNETRRFHIDLLFVPAAWQIVGVDVGSYSEYPAAGLSDHVPVIAHLRVDTHSTEIATGPAHGQRG